MSEQMLKVVGLGPGSEALLAPAARAALKWCDVAVGYSVYTDQVRALFPEKEIFTTPMTREIERCRAALQLAQAGRRVAMVCSGDAGVYGMAGPILELAPAYPGVQVEVIPGLTAALSGAAVLGAPLMNDWCVVSLSDHLTPWSVIEKRLQAAAMGDFALCLYNPMSRQRPGHLRRACEILLAAGKPADTVCGWVQNIGRKGQKHRLLTLAQLQNETVDMFTTVFIGNAFTQNCAGRMVTARGYNTQ